MERYTPHERISDLDRRSYLTGYLSHVILQPDLVNDEYGIGEAVARANRSPRSFHPNERRDLAAYHALHEIAQAALDQTEVYRGDEQILHGERVKTQHREVYSKAARMLISSRIDFTYGSYDTEIAEDVQKALTSDEPYRIRDPLHFVQYVYQRRGSLIGRTLLEDNTTAVAEVPFYENYVPTPAGKLERLHALTADMRMINRALS